MRTLAIVVAALGASASAARADPTAAELQKKGEQLAADRRFTDAIDAFKAADKLEPSAGRSCYIALAYARRELWPQAEIFIARCHTGAAGESLPDWVPEADALIAERIRGATVAEIEIVVVPAEAAAGVALSVSSFAPDETFGPRTKVHLWPGHHVITATAAGFVEQHRTLDVTDKSPKRIVIEMDRPHPWPRRLIIGGVATIGAGVVAYGVMGIAWLGLSDHRHGGTLFSPVYDVSRGVNIGLYAIGAGLVITGYALRRKRRETPAMSLAPVPRGAVLAIEWLR